MSSSPNSGVTLNFKSSTRPRAKVSILIAIGKRSKREISCAAASSGLMIMVTPRRCLIKPISSLYMGLRTRAMVLQCPVFCAIKQQRRFNSSEAVTAISISAVSIPASIKTLILAPFPTMHNASMSSAIGWILSAEMSISVRSVPSSCSCSAIVRPTLPHPTIMICISPPHLSLKYRRNLLRYTHYSTALFFFKLKSKYFSHVIIVNIIL